MIAQTLFISLLQNAAILISAVLLYDYLWVQGEVMRKWYGKFLAGILIALIGYLLMLTPWIIQPGLFFDTRSILLAISGFMIGPIPTLIAMALLSTLRLVMGGPGQLMGIALIISSGLIGILWRLPKRLNRQSDRGLSLFLLGLCVHLVMLSTTLLLPKPMIWPTIRHMVLPLILLYPSGTMLLGLIMQRRVESWGYRKMLIESKALYASLVNNIPAGVFRKTRDGRFDYVNDLFCKLKGLSQEEIVGKSPKELALYEEQKEKEGGYQKPPVQRTLGTIGTEHHEWIIRHGMPIVVEESYPHDNGQVDYFQVVKTPILDADGNVIGSQGMQFDITQHKRTEEALLAEQYLLNTFMDNTPDVIYFKDRESRIIRHNKAYVTLLGSFDEHTMIGKTDFDFFTAEHAKKAFDDEQAIMRTGRPMINIEEMETWKDGRKTWVITSKFPLTDKKGTVVGTFGVSKDITSIKTLEQELTGAKLKAEESDRLKTAFLHNISHEIRTPMNAIMGFTGFLSDPGIDENQKTHFIDVIQQSSHQLLSIIDDIVRIATIEAGQEKMSQNEVNLNHLMQFELDQFSSRSKEKALELGCSMGLDDNRSVIIADETKLRQVLSNLLVNAFKFTQSGSVDFGYQLKQGSIEFFVKDTGIGIPESMKESIFNRFSQVESSISRQYGGSGLGLSICKAYVELHGGKIWVESIPEKGSTFLFTIPYKPTTYSGNESVSVVSQEPSAIQVNPGENLDFTILVAEDEDLNFMMVREMLKRLKVKVLRASNGQEAVDSAKENQVDLVLMDLKMPVMDGYEATRLIKEFKPTLTIIALTAYSLESDKEKALNSGCSDVIVKPINRENLYRRLEEYMSHRAN